MLNVGDGHWLYVEKVGNPNGIPALFLHGGPGSGAQHVHRNLFDADKCHIILFDQRGAGRSHPYLSTHANTTQHLIADIERIRQFIGIEKWLVVGGSWGSTLAVAYAQAYPERVSGLVLRAVLLGAAEEAKWAFVDGPKKFRPELFEDFKNRLPETERADPLTAYLSRLASPDDEICRPAAHAWNAYERALSEIQPATTMLPKLFDKTNRVPPTPVMEAHYISNAFFLEPGQLLDNAHRLAKIPGIIVQGRYDLLCPPAAAHALSTAWGNCQLRFVENAGHSAYDPGVESELQKAVRELSN